MEIKNQSKDGARKSVEPKFSLTPSGKGNNSTTQKSNSSILSVENQRIPKIFDPKNSHAQELRIQNKCINLLTKDGKKAKAFSLLKTAFTLVMKKKRTQSDGGKPSSIHSLTANMLFLQSIENVKPIFEVRKVRVAGNTLLVPALISFERQENKALRWIIEAAQERKRKNPHFLFEECLAIEILEAVQHQGYAKQKRDELHKIAEANRAFAHYKWW
uniref:Ribosomal protein S7 n=1 Tax=Monomastix sp. (strain OKE-1) TaxID=141716 RepID=U5YDX5_MONSK|nr:ribosomal protein S7 [Monomastix sp. OKE-1]AGZ90178.1 ribosomal protein S7 [Monomastix sp. OKE-1]